MNNPLEVRSDDQFTSQNTIGLKATQRAEQAASAARRAEQAASEARRLTRNNMPTNPNSSLDSRKEQVVNGPSPFENLTTQLTGLQEATGKVMDGVAEGVSFISKSLLSNLLQSGNSLPTGPKEAEAQKPQRVSGPNGTGNSRPAQGPRSESWVNITSGKTGGREGGGRG